MTQEQIDGLLAILALIGLAWPFIRARLSKQQIARIEEVADLVVRATEVQGQEKSSAAKMNDAVKRAQAVSKRYRVKASDEEWKVAINDAVYHLKMQDGEVPPKVPQDVPPATTTSLR